jgi:hypothetical protein
MRARHVVFVELVRLWAEVRKLRLRRLGAQEPHPRAFLRARFGELQLTAVDEPQAEHRRLRALAALRHVLQPPGAHQVHEQHELVVVGREQEALRAPLDAAQPLALERLQRRVERLQRGDVRRAGLHDRRSLSSRSAGGATPLAAQARQ